MHSKQEKCQIKSKLLHVIIYMRSPCLLQSAAPANPYPRYLMKFCLLNRHISSLAPHLANYLRRLFTQITSYPHFQHGLPAVHGLSSLSGMLGLRRIDKYSVSQSSMRKSSKRARSLPQNRLRLLAICIAAWKSWQHSP